MAEIILSRIHPDYAQIRAQLQLALTGLDTWKDLLPTSTGQAVIDFVASIGDLDQFAIESSYKEAFLDAKKPSSIYAIAKLLGIRLGRRTPASATVNLSRTDTSGTLTIPSYTEFSGAGTPLFNRSPIVFNIGVTSLAVQLYEGTVKQLTALSDGGDFQLFSPPEQDFQVSDTDVQVTAGSIVIPLVTQGLWNSKGKEAVQDLTFNRGETVILFGNSQYGYKPPVNTPLTFRYVVTAGAAGNSGGFNGVSVSCSDFSQLTGIASTGLVAGADQRPSSFYRRFGPQLFSASERAHIKDEYTAVAANYPSVVDALVVGQRELSPGDNRFMNLVRVSLLKNSTWGPAQYQAFTNYYQQRTMFPVRFYFEEPEARPVDIDANVYCRLEGDLTEIQVAATAAIQKLFEPRAGIIGLNFFKSDIYDAINLASPSVEFVELLEPTTDVFPMFQAPKPPIVTEVFGIGTLTPGIVSYAVTVVTPSGETLAANIGTQTLTGSNSAALLNWTPVPGAIGYRVYGRTFPGAKLIASLPGNVTTFTDVGFPLSSTDVPAFDTSGVGYCILGTLILRMYYTNRRLA